MRTIKKTFNLRKIMDYKKMNAIGIVRLMLTDGVITEEQAAKYFPELVESEDKRIRKALISFLKSPFVNESITDEKVTPWIAWLEKQGEQKPAEWSKEDEREVDVLKAYICSREWSDSHIDRALGIVDELVKKLKSLRPQSSWKPSATDIKVLEEVINFRVNPINYHATLHAILEQLKKLREE